MNIKLFIHSFRTFSTKSPKLLWNEIDRGTEKEHINMTRDGRVMLCTVVRSRYDLIRTTVRHDENKWMTIRNKIWRHVPVWWEPISRHSWLSKIVLSYSSASNCEMWVLEQSPSVYLLFCVWKLLIYAPIPLGSIWVPLHRNNSSTLLHLRWNQFNLYLAPCFIRWYVVLILFCRSRKRHPLKIKSKQMLVNPIRGSWFYRRRTRNWDCENSLNRKATPFEWKVQKQFQWKKSNRSISRQDCHCVAIHRIKTKWQNQTEKRFSPPSSFIRSHSENGENDMPLKCLGSQRFSCEALHLTKVSSSVRRSSHSFYFFLFSRSIVVIIYFLYCSSFLPFRSVRPFEPSDANYPKRSVFLCVCVSDHATCHTDDRPNEWMFF